MLEFIREKMQGAFATVIIGFFCVAFALWGVERLFSGGGKSKAVVVVNGDEIFEPEIANAIDMLRKYYMNQLGGKVDSSFLNDKMLRGPAVDTLVKRKLLASETTALNMGIGSSTIDRNIVSDPVFSRDGKRFDPEYYQEQLRKAQITAAAYQKQLRQQLMFGQLQSGIADTAFVTDAQVMGLARLMAQKRDFEYIRIPLQQYVDSVIVADDAIEAYYKSHANEFMTEETVGIEYIELNKADIARSVKVEDKDLQEAYDKERAAFKSTSERRAAHILVDAKDETAAKAKLQEIDSKLSSGADFAAVAKQYSIDEGSAAKGGDVGFTSGTAFVPAFESALASLQKVGDISKPVKTEFGYHIIKLLEERQTEVPPFEKRKAELEQQLRMAKAGTAFAEKLEQLNEATYSAGDLAGPAKELGLTVKKSPAFARHGGVDIAGQQKVIEAAFSADLVDSGKNSQMIELSADRALVLRVSEHHLPVVKELAQVKPSIIEKLKREQAVTAIHQKIQDLKTKAQSENSLAGIAATEKLKVITRSGKTRNAGGDEAEILPSIFKLPKPATGQAVLDSMEMANGDYALIHLIAVQDVAVTTDSPEYKAAEQQLSGGIGSMQFATFEQQLRSKAKIINHDVVADSNPTTP
ncbi:MAG TPA: SurA N-terminal domain-containing protein [Pseudomonadales bacterium]|nr:SurA N-terminal domain-containing protein [Pseudomonadales bacterium]